MKDHQYSTIICMRWENYLSLSNKPKHWVIPLFRGEGVRHGSEVDDGFDRLPTQGRRVVREAQTEKEAFNGASRH